MTLKDVVGISTFAQIAGLNVENAENPLSARMKDLDAKYQHKRISLTKVTGLFSVLVNFSFMKIATNSIVEMKHARSKGTRNNALPKHKTPRRLF